MLLKKYICFTAILLLLISGCSNTPVIMVKTGSGDDKITAKAGKAFSVKLEAQLSTGYSWKLVDAPVSLKTIKELVISDGKSITGSIDVQEFVFKSPEKGDFTLTFKYGEHWKKNPQFVNSSTIKVKID